VGEAMDIEVVVEDEAADVVEALILGINAGVVIVIITT
jgi:hypothetical protein